MKKNLLKSIIIISAIIALSVIAFFVFKKLQVEQNKPTMTRVEALNCCWGEIKEYMTGVDTIRACTDYYYSGSEGQCNDLAADIDKGRIVILWLPGAVRMNIVTEFDKYGYATDTDPNNNDWEFALFTNSVLFKKALKEWSEQKGVIVKD